MSENKPRWEVKYEKLLAEEPITNKIKELQDEINADVTGDFKNQEEYRKAVVEHKNKIPKLKE